MACTDKLQCITMGALLNQTMFLILIGLLKGRTYAQIVQSFHDVSLHRSLDRTNC